MRLTIDAAAARLIAGDVVALPTETVYGLAALLASPAAIDRIFTIKGRPRRNPLITHLGSSDQLAAYLSAPQPPHLTPLIDAFWPGPLTLVLPVEEAAMPAAVRAGLPTAAFRIPAHSITRQLLDRVGPVVMPSANLSGKPTATSADHVIADFGASVAVVDGGPCSGGVESTILIYDADCWQIGRYGAITADQIAAIIGYTPSYATHDVACPGRRWRHYAPEAELLLSSSAIPCDAIIGYEGRDYPNAVPLLILGPEKRPDIVAARLYDVLRSVDACGYRTVWVDSAIPNAGLWLTIRDRLNKAASSI